MAFLDNLQWRFAAKGFDQSREVSDDNIDKILEAIHMTPTSFGLQPFHIIDVTNEDLKAKIREVGFDQPQITEANHLLIFCVRTDVVKRIDDYIETASGGDEAIKEKMKGLKEMMKGAMKGKTDLELENWAKRQVYIALGFALAAAAELKIDSCPMEGFIPEKVDQILQLPGHLKSVVIMTVGYRSEDPKHPKFRFPKEELFENKS